MPCSQEAIEWIANYLLEHNPNKPRTCMPADLELESLEGSDDADFAPYIQREAEKEATQAEAAIRIQATVRGRQDRVAVAEKRAAKAKADEELRAAVRVLLSFLPSLRIMDYV